MMRIPGQGDTPPPLIASIRRAENEASAVSAEAEPGLVKKRRKGRRKGEDHSWEHQSGHRSARGEAGQMRWLLAGGAALLAATLGGVAYFMSAKKPEPAILMPQPVSDVSATAGDTAKAPTESDKLAAAEVLARKFLEARTVDEILPLVRDRETVEPKIRDFYREGGLVPPGMSSFNLNRGAIVLDKVMEVPVKTVSEGGKSIAFIETPGGLKVDWESWIGWSEMGWKEFLKAKPDKPVMFRVILSEVDYYNFSFKDDRKWKSFQLMSADKEQAVYGYVERDSVLAQQLRPNKDTKEVKLRLSLLYPAGSPSSNQVLIEKIAGEGWVDRDSTR